MTRMRELRVSDPLPLLNVHVDYNPGGQSEYQAQPEQSSYPATTAASKSKLVDDDEEEYNPSGQAQQNDYGYKPQYGAEEDTYKTAYETYQETPKQAEPVSYKVRFDEDDEGAGTFEYKPQAAQVEEPVSDPYHRYK